MFYGACRAGSGDEITESCKGKDRGSLVRPRKRLVEDILWLISELKNKKTLKLNVAYINK